MLPPGARFTHTQWEMRVVVMFTHDTWGVPHIFYDLWFGLLVSTDQKTKRYETPQVACVQTTAAGMAHWLYVKHAPAGKIANYVRYRQSSHLQYHFLSTVAPPHILTSTPQITQFKIIANQLPTLTWHCIFLMHIILLLLTSAQLEMYNNKVHFFAYNVHAVGL
jgi:hypothetical protein